ncbi:OmpA family protein [Sphingosinicella sp.]|uniref:OmpA family protein n=1 Tax=Sphingosinicella sp. TaxID=1917971 RepID=UPI0040378CE3
MAGSLILALAALSINMQQTEPLGDYCPTYLVFFDERSDRLDRRAMAMIDSWMSFARMFEIPQNRFLIEAGTDSEAEARASLDLSFRRGRAVMRYLVSRGYSSSRFVIRSVGARPLTNPSDPASDRRALLILRTTHSNFGRVMGDLVC